MSGWKKILVAASTGVTLAVMATVVASASGPGRAALRSAGTHAVLMASTGPGSGTQPRGGVASGPGPGPIQISIGKTWTLNGPLIVSGTITVTCGPFLPNTTGDSGAQVTVEEALGDKVGHAPAFVSLTCDGARHTYPVTGLVNDVPFRPGDGAVGVTANVSGQDPSSFQFVFQTASAVSRITVK